MQRGQPSRARTLGRSYPRYWELAAAGWNRRREGACLTDDRRPLSSPGCSWPEVRVGMTKPRDTPPRSALGLVLGECLADRTWRSEEGQRCAQEKSRNTSHIISHARCAARCRELPVSMRPIRSLPRFTRLGESASRSATGGSPTGGNRQNWWSSDAIGRRRNSHVHPSGSALEFLPRHGAKDDAETSAADQVADTMRAGVPAYESDTAGRPAVRAGPAVRLARVRTQLKADGQIGSRHRHNTTTARSNLGPGDGSQHPQDPGSVSGDRLVRPGWQASATHGRLPAAQFSPSPRQSRAVPGHGDSVGENAA